MHKLRGARDRASKAAGRRVEGRKPTLVGDALAMARRLRRKNPRTGERRSLREIAVEMAAAGHVNPATGQPYSPEAIRLAPAHRTSALAPPPRAAAAQRAASGKRPVIARMGAASPGWAPHPVEVPVRGFENHLRVPAGLAD